MRKFTASFGSGELSPEMFGRVDDVKFQYGLGKCLNFITKPQGPAENRTGFTFIRAAKYADKHTRILPFKRSLEQTFVIEFGDKYCRFHTHGQTLLDATGQPYELATPYDHNDVFGIAYVQSADVLTLVHPKYAPRELRRLSAAQWELRTINLGRAIQAPRGITTAPHTSLAQYGQKYEYVVTTVGEDGSTESAASQVAYCTNNLNASGAWNKISWVAVPGASAYRVYRKNVGVFGLIGGTTETAVIDTNKEPNAGIVPPIYEASLQKPDDYPTAVAYFEQRRAFAGTINQPQNVWMTRSGTESAMSYSMPLKDTDRVAFRIAGREFNYIRHLVPMHQLIILTDAAEWSVTSVNSDALTPTSFVIRPQGEVGSSMVRPLVIRNNLIYVTSEGGRVCQLSQAQQIGILQTDDLSIRSHHLFDGFDIVDMTYVPAPHSTVWFVSTTGKLLGLTYVPEQLVAAWHQHDTQFGLFKSCASVTEAGGRALYCVVERTLNGRPMRTIERMAKRSLLDPADAFFVDCGLSYDGDPAKNFSGLEHLEGCTVSILADGAVHPQQVVKDGAIRLEHACKKVHVGLPITADLETLPLTVPVDQATGQGRCKNISKVWLRVYRSSGIFVGPKFDRLTEAKQRTTEPCGTPPALKSEEIPIAITPSWGKDGTVCIRQKDPLPLTIVSMTVDAVLGA